VYYNNLVHCDKEYCLPRTTLSVVSNTTYLLHIANGGVSAMLNTAIEGHTMTVVEVDGIPCKLQEVVFLDLHVGQRVGVLITTDKPEGAYWISSIVRGRQTDPVRTGGAFLIYNNEEHNLDGQAGEDDPARLALIESQPEWDDWEFMRLQQQLFESLVPETMPTLEDVDRTFVFLNTQERFEPHHVNNSPTGGDVSGIGIGDNLQERPQCKCDSSDGFLKWAVDRKSFVNPTTPLLHSMFFETNEKSEKELEDEGFYKLYESEVYDIVLQNFPACNGACEVHPWHLHGHHFWHVGTFEGAYDPSVGYPEEEAGNNYKRDTILLVGADKQNTDATCSELREPCGNAVIRFEADNPGAW
jgi:L-ascorbate oxidase